MTRVKLNSDIIYSCIYLFNIKSTIILIITTTMVILMNEELQSKWKKILIDFFEYLSFESEYFANLFQISNKII